MFEISVATPVRPAENDVSENVTGNLDDTVEHAVSFFRSTDRMAAARQRMAPHLLPRFGYDTNVFVFRHYRRVVSHGRFRGETSSQIARRLYGPPEAFSNVRQTVRVNERNSDDGRVEKTGVRRSPVCRKRRPPGIFVVVFEMPTTLDVHFSRRRFARS